MIVLRDYQKDLVDEINKSQSKRNCIQSSTGSGKTLIFSYLANNFKGNVLILVNRTELIEQTARNIIRPNGVITAKVTDVKDVTIGMVESVNNRIKKGSFNLDNIDLLIIDECHNLQFVKVIEGYKNRLLGFTATPVTDKKEYYFKCNRCGDTAEKSSICCNKETKEFSKKVTLSDYYGPLITGIEIKELIEKGYLTQVKNLVCDADNLSKLKTDKSGQFTSKSENEVFNNLAGLRNLVANYEAHSIGKKTMVFNSNIEANDVAYNKFKELGYNVRSYDSKSKEDRKEVVDWFKETPGSILMSVGVFTTGFDVEDVECILLNKATQSLSLYHQIIGRGGRITDLIYKPYFLCIDLGGNVDRFGSWSDSVNWEYIYYDTNEKQKRINQLEDFKICKECDSMVLSFPCEFCGAEEKKKKVKEKIVIAREVEKLPKPKALHILKYALSNDLDINEAKKLTANYILDMFIYSNISKESARKRIGYLKKGINEMITPIYFALHKSNLEGNRRRTIKDFEKKVYDKLNKYYENRS